MDFKAALEVEIESPAFSATKKVCLQNALDAPSIPRGTSPGKPAFEIKSIGETAFQRAIFLSGETVLLFADKHEERIQWLDLELPTTFSGAGRRRCVDLIGNRNDAPFLCELKYKKIIRSRNGSSGDSPHYGIIELLIHYYRVKHLVNYAQRLDEEKVYHKPHSGLIQKFKWENVSNTLILAANESYWNWHFYARPKHHQDKLCDLVGKFNNDYKLSLLLFKISDVDFALQKIQASTYEPSMNQKKKWEQI